LTLTKVTSLTVRKPFGLDVRFNNGTGGVYDCSEMVARGHNLLADLRNPSFFAKVRLEDGAPTWPNDYDIDPEWLRRTMEAAGELHNVAAE
jgi:hypothetical protein